MVSRENTVIVASIVAALVIFFGAATFTQVDSTVLMGVVLLVGVVVPILINEYLDTRQPA